MRAALFVLLACLLGPGALGEGEKQAQTPAATLLHRLPLNRWSLTGCPFAPPAAPLCQTYVVKSGDSVWGIANDLGILASDLTAALSQCISYVDGQTVLQLGQCVCLPPYYPACQYVSSSGAWVWPPRCAASWAGAAASASGSCRLKCTLMCPICRH